MTGIAELKMAADGLKSVMDIAKGLGALRGSEREAKLAEMTRQVATAYQAVIDATLDQAAVLNRNQELEREVLRLKESASEKDRYQLVAVSPGVFAYAVKESARGVEPVHYVCQPCCDKGHKGVLVQTGNVRRPENLHIHRCPLCQTNYAFGNAPPIPPTRDSTYPDRFY